MSERASQVPQRPSVDPRAERAADERSREEKESSERASQAPQRPTGSGARAGTDWTPAPQAAPRGRMLAAQARLELQLLLRNGEQVGLTLIIPLLLLVFFNLPILYSLGGRRIDFVVPSIMALSVMSAAFTGLAIGTGFERKYGVLKRLGGTALRRSTLLFAKTLAVVGLEVIQLVLVVALGLALGWHPHGDPLLAAAFILVGTVTFGALGLLLAGTLRAEVTLAAANLAWLILLFCGGIAVPLSKYPDAVAGVLRLLPSAALSDGLHDVLQHGAGLPLRALVTLAVWAVVAVPIAVRWFRWE